MAKYNIEEGEVLEKKPYKKKLFVMVMFFILIAFVFYLFMKHDLLDKLKGDRLGEKSLDNPTEYINPPIATPDYSNEIAQIKLQVKTLNAENQNFKATLKILSDRLNQKNMIATNEPKELINKQATDRINRVLVSMLSSLDGDLKNAKNLKAIESNFDQLILILSLFVPYKDDSILAQVEELKMTTKDELEIFIDQVDSELITIDNELWTTMVNNSERAPFPVIKKADEDKPISGKLEEPYSLKKKIKEEIMKFVDIAPVDNTVSPQISNLDRLTTITKLSVKIAASRTLLWNLEFEKLNSYLNGIKSNLEFHFPEMVEPKSSIDRISKKLNNFGFDNEGLDKIISLLENNIKEQ
ncbi:MAG: hypothetical protein CBC29_03495 [Methylococcaceae bacterium TMED69]|mgnify:FL=1|nr:MAG: hypothetical protein CBC29_03495 [Methylococcaceae bacterium TMED69]